MLKTRLRANSKFFAKLEVYYQAICQLDDITRAVKAEALIRYKTDCDSAGSIIKEVDKRGCHLEFDLFVLGEVCGFLRNCQQIGGLVPVSVNLSKETLLQPGAGEMILSRLDDFPELYFKTNLIDFEINEEAILTQSVVKENVQKLLSAGYNLVLDDYGVSRVSLFEVLPSFNIGAIKFDRSVVLMITNEEEEGRAAAAMLTNLVKSVIDVVHSGGVKIVFEGVESLNQLDYIREQFGGNAVIQIQGYIVEKAIKGKEFLGKYIKI